MKILGYYYRIVADGDVDNMGSCGRLHAKSQKIQIATDLCEQQKVSSVLHEIIEALNYHLELKMQHEVIMSLEAALYQVLSDSGVDLSPLIKEIS